uniref:THUMP domain-containing protein n=1 Tax=Acrobeloides nanus TaxID=290746 RepID=A0A914CI74_9BILA
MPPPIKKKKNIYRPNQTKKKCVDPGSRGLFFTCENEKQAVKEARNLIDKYLSTAEPSDENEAGDEYNEDVSETLNKLCKEASSSKTNFPKLRPTGVKNCLFFEMSFLSTDELYSIVDKILVDCQTAAQCRFLQRIIPIEETCSTDIKDVSLAISKVIQRHFNRTTASGGNSKPTYAVDFKARNNDQISKTVVFDMVDTALKTVSTTGAKVNLSLPELTLVVHVTNKTVMLACLRDFIQRRKFSLHVPKVSTD